MRYIGNKENLCDKIHYTLLSQQIQGESLFDVFAGTTSVSQYFKHKGYQITSSDLMYFSFVLQKAYIANNNTQLFSALATELPHTPHKLFTSNLEIVLSFLDNIFPVEGFIFKNYTPEGTAHLHTPRMYFSNENGRKIDAIRQQIELWYQKNKITENEYFVLLACLIESVSFYANVAGIYAAFHKKWDPRAVKPLTLRPIKLLNNHKENQVYNTNSVALLNKIEADIFYLDPPYNARQYAPNYHLIETIAKYDTPSIKGVTGMRDYTEQKSLFCNPSTALEELNKIAQQGKYKTLVLSYNSEGIMPQEAIIQTLSQYGKVTLTQFDYQRFKSNNNGESQTKKHIQEQLYILKRQ